MAGEAAENPGSGCLETAGGCSRVMQLASAAAALQHHQAFPAQPPGLWPAKLRAPEERCKQLPVLPLVAAGMEQDHPDQVHRRLSRVPCAPWSLRQLAVGLACAGRPSPPARAPLPELQGPATPGQLVQVG